jgi:hypothetical protein
VANEWLKVWQLAALVTPASVTARFTAFCTTLGSRCCLPWLPDSRSRQRLRWGNTHWSPDPAPAATLRFRLPPIPGAGTPGSLLPQPL